MEDSKEKTVVREAPEVRGRYLHFLTVPTRWMDNDVYGHVNNVVYYEYFDTAVNAWLHEQVGLAAREGASIGVVAETTCRYLHEVAFPQDLVVGLRCDRLGTTSVTYRLAIFRRDLPEEGPAAVGRFVHVYVDRDTRRPVPVPPEVREAVLRGLVVIDPGAAPPT